MNWVLLPGSLIVTRFECSEQLLITTPPPHPRYNLLSKAQRGTVKYVNSNSKAADPHGQNLVGLLFQFDL